VAVVAAMTWLWIMVGALGALLIASMAAMFLLLAMGHRQDRGAARTRLRDHRRPLPGSNARGIWNPGLGERR
jgi:hypothetical protein